MTPNKIIYNNNVLIDLTNDTITKETLFNGIKAHDKTGAVITGTFLKEHPKILNIEEILQDSLDLPLIDEDGEIILGWCIYERK